MVICMDFKKGQAALDFLMTYGWAIALVVIIAAVLFSLGIFDVSNFVGNKAAGFSGIAVKGWNVDTAGTLTVKVSNQVGQQIRVDSINATIGANSSVIGNSTFQLAPGADSATLSTSTGAFGTQASGSGYTARIVIKYTDLNANFAYT